MGDSWPITSREPASSHISLCSTVAIAPGRCETRDSSTGWCKRDMVSLAQSMGKFYVWCPLPELGSFHVRVRGQSLVKLRAWLFTRDMCRVSFQACDRSTETNPCFHQLKPTKFLFLILTIQLWIHTNVQENEIWKLTFHTGTNRI